MVSNGVLWSASKYFLAYFDLKTKEIKKRDGRIVWPLTEEELKEYGRTWPYHFKDGVIYRIKARELIDKTVPEGRLASYYNRFMVVKVMEENVQHEDLLAILTEYRKPISISDPVLGTFDLNKNLRIFQGHISWFGNGILVSLDVVIDDSDSWTKAMNVLRTLFEQQEQKDLAFRTFAAEQLVELANDWLPEEDMPEIVKQSFIDRIQLIELSVSFDGNFTAYYDDDDMFVGHVITVYGNIQKGLDSANIEG
jgi:hypothetical protein